MRGRGVWSRLKRRVRYEKPPSKFAGHAQHDRIYDIAVYDDRKTGNDNRTNARTIAELYGPETNDWRGRHITLFPTTTDFRGASVDCIRVRPEAPVRSEPLEDFGKPEIVLPRREMAVPSGNGIGLDL